MMMERAIENAYRPLKPPYPNPRVGAVIVRDGKIISEGFHESYVHPHAENMALKALNYRADGATIYVTLEPCCPFEGKRNPSCAEMLIKAGIARVVVAVLHPEPGQDRGMSMLKSAGVQVESGLLENEAEWLLKGLRHFQKTGRPFVMAKWAMTADGLIAPASRHPGEISGTEISILLHKLRHQMDAVLVGIGTVLSDNPRLNCRAAGFRHPTRVVVDPDLKTPLWSHVANPTADMPTIVLCRTGANPEQKSLLSAQGAEVVELVADSSGGLRIGEILACLAARKLYSLLVEGGSSVHGRFFDECLVDELLVIVAPKVLGGKDGLNPVGGRGRLEIPKAVRLEDFRTEMIGPDIAIRARPIFDQPPV